MALPKTLFVKYCDEGSDEDSYFITDKNIDNLADEDGSTDVVGQYQLVKKMKIKRTVSVVSEEA